MSSADLDQIASRLIGVPVTYEHRGLSAAAAADMTLTTAGVRSQLGQVAHRAFKASGDLQLLTMAPVGVVTNAWVHNGVGLCTGKILSSMTHVSRLVSTGRLNGLSLTHDPTTNQPVELTLTKTPARPGCFVVASGPPSVLEYKRLTQPARKPLAMDTTTPAAIPTPLEAAIAKLENADRALVEARLEEMYNAAGAAKRDASAAEQRAATLEAIGTDNAVIQDHIDTVTSQLSDHQKKVFNLNPVTLGEQMNSGNVNRAREGMRRLLMACSQQMMTQQAQMSEGGQPAAKRMRSAPSPEVVQQPTAPPVAGESSLRAALASTFEL